MDSETIYKETATSMAPIEENAKICANCGTPITDTYCPHCGQHIGQQRLKLRNFLFSSVQEICKLNSGFFYTFCRLAYQPWVVIRNYINGHRVRYTTPINMLIILVLYVAIINSLFGDGIDIGNTLSINISFVDDTDAHTFSYYMYKLAESLLNNRIFTNILLCIPMAMATYLTYIKFGSRRYNSAEFLVAAIYMVCSLIVYDFITLPFKFINDALFTFFNTLAPIPVIVISLLRAFKVPNPLTRISLIILNFVIALTLLIAYVLAIFFISAGGNLSMSDLSFSSSF
jgi:hypothetical protein